MLIKEAFKEQFHATLAMLGDCIEKCPDDIWDRPAPPIDEGDRVIYRHFWRIAMHAIFFAHLYLGQGEEAFEPWAGPNNDRSGIWGSPWDLEPYELPPDAEPISRQDALGYLAYVDGLVDRTVDGLDLETSDSGFPWYPSIGKLSHELLNLRHVQGHVGQLSEILMSDGIDTRWISKS